MHGTDVPQSFVYTKPSSRQVASIIKKQQPPSQKPAPHRKKKRYEKSDAGQRVNYVQQGRETCIHTSSFISHDRMG